MSRVCLYYVPLAETDRWVRGDRFVRPLLRRIVRGAPRPSGVDRVFLNLRAGLDRLGVPYEINLPFRDLRADDRVGVIGRGRASLAGYDRPNPIVAGVALMTHPSEWPTLCDEYPVAAYLQHSQWANDVYVPYFGDRCVVWPVGVDTDRWQSVPGAARPVDFLVYDKIPWERELMSRELVDPIMRTLERRGYTTRTLRYGEYAPGDYAAALAQSKAMLFLSPHESQGLAYQEALSSGVPVLAWDPGRLQDPNRFAWGAENVPTSSVPYFDARCGVRFRNAGEFEEALATFEDALARGAFAPREFVLERLTLERCAQHYLSILEAAQVSTAAGRLAAVRA